MALLMGKDILMKVRCPIKFINIELIVCRFARIIISIGSFVMTIKYRKMKINHEVVPLTCTKASVWLS
jgi:hypothetical protein